MQFFILQISFLSCLDYYSVTDKFTPKYLLKRCQQLDI